MISAYKTTQVIAKDTEVWAALQGVCDSGQRKNPENNGTCVVPPHCHTADVAATSQTPPADGRACVSCQARKSHLVHLSASRLAGRCKHMMQWHADRMRC